MSQNFNALVTGVTTFGQLYGIINANMEAIRTFFSGTSFPANPVQWQPCLRTDTSRFYIYDGSTWQDFTVYLPAYLAIASEIQTARGAAASLDARLDVALNEDGTLKAGAPAGSWWMLEGGTVARVDASTFTVTGDKTAIYKKNRAIFLDQTTDAYGYVAADSVYTSVTTVTVRGCTVDTGLTAVQYGQAPNNSPNSVNEDALAGLSGAADKFPYFTGAGAMSLATLTSFMRTLLDDADAATARATLGITVVPAGTVIAWATGTVPSGYLECNGASLLRTTYADLFSVVGTTYGYADASHFNLPDYRGRFLRGWANGQTTDPDRASRTNRGDGTTGDNVGTKQADDYKAHKHGLYYGSSGAGGGNSIYSLTDQISSVTNPMLNSPTSGGNETRPININVMWCIKY